jgi:hypothetical protein
MHIPDVYYLGTLEMYILGFCFLRNLHMYMLYVHCQMAMLMGDLHASYSRPSATPIGDAVTKFSRKVRPPQGRSVYRRPVHLSFDMMQYSQATLTFASSTCRSVARGVRVFARKPLCTGRTMATKLCTNHYARW